MYQELNLCCTRAEKKLLMKLKEAEEAVREGDGWLSLDELKAAMENSL